MGLNASSNEWCCHSDRMVIGLPWAKNIVDDTIIWAPTLQKLLERAVTILERCRDLNTTISLLELLELGKEITFAGHIISLAGIGPDDSKYKATADFPTPTNVSQLRSFLGLANQLTAFVPDLAHMTAALRPLLKKGIAWTWTDDMDKKFERVKLLLTTTTTVQPFNPSLTSILMTDASRLYGIGFTLLQALPGEKWSLVQCFFDTNQNQICNHRVGLLFSGSFKNLLGLEMFKIWTDHKPLVGIFQKNICNLENPRLMRIRENIMEYTPPGLMGPR